MKAYGSGVDAEKLVKWAGLNPELELKWAPDSVALICFTSGYLLLTPCQYLDHCLNYIMNLLHCANVFYMLG